MSTLTVPPVVLRGRVKRERQEDKGEASAQEHETERIDDDEYRASRRKLPQRLEDQRVPLGSYVRRFFQLWLLSEDLRECTPEVGIPVS